MNQSIEMTGKSVEEAVRRALDELGRSQDEVTVEVLEEESGFLGIGAKATVRVSVIEKPGPESFEQDVPEEAGGVSTEMQEAIEEMAVESSETVNESPETAVVDTTTVEESTTETTITPVAENQVAVENKTETEETDTENLPQVAAEVITDFLNDILAGFNLSEVNQVEVNVEDERIVATIDGDDCGILIGRRGETLNSLQYLCSLIANKTTHSRMRVSLDIGGYKAKRENSVSSLAIRTAQRAVRTGQAFELTPMSAAERRVVHETLQDFEGIVTYSEGDEPQRYVVIDLAFEDEEFTPEDTEI